jgi:hypothetical protein
MKINSSIHFCTTLSFLSFFVSTSFVLGSPVPANLGSGLDVLVRERVAQQSGLRGGVPAALVQQAQSYRDIAITSDAGMVKVYIHLAPKRKGVAQFVPPASAIVTATDMTYRSGVIEAFVNLDDVPAIARNKGVKSVILAIKPILDVGAAQSQGVVQHRVNLVTQDGTGVTIGCMSDSFDKSPSATDGYVVDQGTGDLPGPSNTAGNPLPVEILDDPIPSASDEGRAMAQLVHDMAPKARLGFATASTGQVSFADNIRSLAGLATGSNMIPGFAARVIVDDLFYSDSPMFGTSLVGRAVNEVAGAPTHVSYFSSAGNRASNQGYFSNYRNVSSASLATALAGTNIPVASFSTIPAAQYAGGFHNFRTDAGQDIAQLISNGLSGTGTISFQWDDPFDVDPPTFNPTPFFTSSGAIPGTTDFILTGLTAGAQYRVAVTDPSDAADVVVTILDPNNVQILSQDTGFNEVVFFFAPIAGNYTVRVSPFAGAAASPYDINAYVASGTGRVTVDYNLLFFNATTGAFIRSIASNNFATNQPLEIASLGTFPAGGMMQMIVARANTPTAPVPATKIRYVLTGVCQPLEYFDYQTPITFGHNHEPGAISVAAYNPWRPFLPEDFTSPGPSYIYFDQAANRLATPIIRQKPDVAALDGANNTFFSADDSRDLDTQPNFFGTSAAAPHAAAIAALVLQAHGGAVTQPQMRTILQRAGFNHDLDPFYASGSAKAGGQKVTITARGNAGNFNNSDTRSLNVDDTKTFGVSYVGSGSVATLSINLATANPNGGDIVAGSPGLAWDNRALLPRTANSGFAFTVGQVTGSFVPGNVTSATYSLPAPPPAVAGQNFQLDLTFAANTLIAGNSFTFGADRDEAHSSFNPPVGTAAYGNSADLLGAAVTIPAGTITPGGGTFSGTFGNAAAFSGTFINVIGKGYSTLDGFGFINAEDAVNQPLP